ncbi:tetratricopeptide repeat protein [Actinokineospora sp. UTMC 2448]|uniref:tetratricopeptide repeat protein n=1 Tax=Actinokineospora sp. UTMC 2448 TaxID=2268449 RepID=UPI0021647CE4|nr:tetratricopeptide repeat protein [Actinokineospora sp. UTMC 2448]UVS79462.1 Regulatory protein AfsR [Actinokineospora sp. UTMC 2448]
MTGHNSMSNPSGNVVQAGSVHGGVHFHVGGQQRSVPRQLPSPPRGFAGRDNLLAALDDMVAEHQEDTAPLVVLSGMGGVGKTTLALRWAHQRIDRYPDGQLHVDLRGYGPDEPLAPEAVLARFLRALGVEHVPGDTDERAALFRSMLAGKRSLVLLDNAHDAAQVRPLLPGPASCVLITSRTTLAGLLVDPGAALLPVDVLDEDAAREVIRVLVGPRAAAEPAAADALIDRCARLPLALRVAAGLATSRPTSPLSDIVRALDDEQSRLDAFHIGVDSRTAVRTAFSWSYRNLAAEPARLFRLFGSVGGPDLSVAALVALAGDPVRSVSQSIAALADAQLVTYVGTRVAMHDLLKAYAAELASPVERQAATTRLFGHFLHGAAAADQLISPNRFPLPLAGDPVAAPRFSDLDSAVAWLGAELPTMSALLTSGDDGLDEYRWQLAYTLRGYFFLTKDWDVWIATHSAALAAALRIGDPAAAATTGNNLGIALLERGDPDAAEPHFLAALTSFERLGDLRGAANAMGNQAWVLHGRGDNAGALDLADRALDNYRRCGAESNVGITLRGIAVFEAALGRVNEAIDHLHEAMAVFSRFPSPLDTIMALNCLGEVNAQAGDAEASRSAHRRALTQSLAHGSVYERARAHRGLARAAVLDGDHVTAVADLREALALYTALRATEAQEAEQELRRLSER